MREKNFRRIVVILLWLLLWQGLDMAVGSELVMAGPVDTLTAFCRLFGSWDFYRVILCSVLRIICGLAAAFVCGLGLSVLAYRFQWVREFLRPAVSLMKSVPVASFVILALLWIGSANLSILIVFLIAFPLFYSQLLTGYGSVDQGMLEVAKVYRYSSFRRVVSIYIPAFYAEWRSTCGMVIGLSFKAGVAAEVIAQPVHSIGERLYLAKLYFNTGELFAWTAVIVALSACTEKLVVWLMDRGCRRICKDKVYHPMPASYKELFRGYRLEEDGKKETFRIRNLYKAYGEKVLFDHLDLEVFCGARVAVIGESGIGKTTFLRILAGLEAADYTEKPELEKVSLAFQETRLIGHNNAISNLVFSMPAWKGKHQNAFLAAEVLQELFEMREMFVRTDQMSGGMRKRVEVARAMFADSRVLLLDEPFSGLDEENRQKMITFIDDYQFGRTLFFTAHDEEETEALEPDFILRLGKNGVDFLRKNA